MPDTIFYSWQSDRPNNVCRSLIEHALETALSSIAQEFDVDPRPDRDTKDVAGSPPIAETIRRKIRECRMFVADLIFVGTSETERNGKKRLISNPNVMIEYGYAFAKLKDTMIVGVLNTAYGGIEDLPFDLAHRRSAIEFFAPEGTDENLQSERRSARIKLARDLEHAIRAVLKTEQDDRSTGVEAFEPAKEADGVSSFADQGTTITSNGRSGSQLYVGPRPRYFVRLFPQSACSSLGSVETLNVLSVARLFPLDALNAGGWDIARNQWGAVSFHSPRDASVIDTLTQLFRSREIWGIACLPDRSGQQNQPIRAHLLESFLKEALPRFVKAMVGPLELTPPINLIIGVDGVKGHGMITKFNQFGDDWKRAIIHDDVIISETTIEDPNMSPEELTAPFLNKLWDAAGMERPENYVLNAPVHN